MKIFGAILASSALGDVYFHFPRGSNNRLNENTENRANDNRVFDSQNNNRGGYNVGDATDQAAGNNKKNQNRAIYFESTSQAPTEIQIEWWNQHGCGKRDENDGNWVNCQIVLQYMCEHSSTATIQNGLQTNTAQYKAAGEDETLDEFTARRDADIEASKNRGLHESWDDYETCVKRDRNYGLFTADQEVQRGGAIYTRQNPNGGQSGYECPEERDYYPYWHPTAWKDIAVLTSDEEKCDKLLENSSNRQMRFECIENMRGYSKWNTEDDCIKNGGEWIGFYNSKFVFPNIDSEEECSQVADNLKIWDDVVWGKDYSNKERVFNTTAEACILLEEAPSCLKAPWSRANHLGHSDKNDYFSTFRWALPNYHGLVESQECVLRIRYNITTNDYEDEFDNDETATYFQGKEINENPEVIYKGLNLQLAINTAQTGRVFQDRSHIFQLKPRPKEIAADKRIVNLGVRGRRGNIVQTFPAVEYDFSPTILEIYEDDLVHFQWEGSNTVPASDGEGTESTDRSNVVPFAVNNGNIPAGEVMNDGQRDYFSLDSKTHFHVMVVKKSMLEEVHHHCREAKMAIPDVNSTEFHEKLVEFVNDKIAAQEFPITTGHIELQMSNSSYHVMMKNGTIIELDEKARIFEEALCVAPLDHEKLRSQIGGPEIFEKWIWSSMNIRDIEDLENLKLQLASSGYYGCYKPQHCDTSMAEKTEELQNQLDNAPASFHGNIVQMKTGTHHFMGTRNNNFSNRAQKGTIIVKEGEYPNPRSSASAFISSACLIILLQFLSLFI